MANLEKTLDGLEADDVILLNRSAAGDLISAELSTTERGRGRENFDFYCFLIWPFVESAWLGAVSLMGLTPPSRSRSEIWLDLKQAQETAQLVLYQSSTITHEREAVRLTKRLLTSTQLGKTLYHQGELSYFEAVNKETLKNAFQLFEEEGIILISESKDSKLPTRIRLATDWTPHRDETTGKIIPEGKLWQFAETIARSRREGYVFYLHPFLALLIRFLPSFMPVSSHAGEIVKKERNMLELTSSASNPHSKNRRDNATVSTRVLALSDKVGRDLFTRATTDGDPTPAGKTAASVRKRRRKEIQTRAKL